MGLGCVCIVRSPGCDLLLRTVKYKRNFQMYFLFGGFNAVIIQGTSFSESYLGMLPDERAAGESGGICL